MELKNQVTALNELRQYAASESRSIIISGVEGCGKTYIAQRYAEMLGIKDFYVTEPKIDDVREIMYSSAELSTPIVICIENLDCGVVGVSNAILKFVEEPTPNVFIIITCRNPKRILDTIHSRCVTIHVPPMCTGDIQTYAKKLDNEKYSAIEPSLWNCINSIREVEIVLNLTVTQRAYISSLLELCGSKDAVSTLIWKLQNFPDNTAVPIGIAVKYMMLNTTSNTLFNACHSCLQALSLNRLSTHAILAKLCFTLKYITI